MKSPLTICGALLLPALAACAHPPRPAAPAPSDAAAWRTEPLDSPPPPPPPPAPATALLTHVEVAPEAGYDRVAFDFAGALPGYRVAFEAAPVHRCGSGDPVELPGAVLLVVAFRGAAAHDDAGHATVAERDRRPHLDALRALTLFCDFEGDVSWALALPRATRFRVTRPAGAARLLIDLEHPR